MYKAEFKINTMCKVLKVSRSGYYRWQKSQGKQENSNSLLDDIRRVFIKSRKNYGSPRIYRQLKSEGVPCGRHRIARFMQEDGIVARKRNKYKKPVSKQRIKPIANNVLNREFNVEKKNSVWVCDVSYFWTRSGWIHLAIVMDLYSRKIVGWSMGNRVDKELSQSALKMAILNREPNQKLLHHSDQGAEYTNKDYQSLLIENKMNVSMSRRANCYDNAVAESFFKTIKSELTRNQKFTTLDEARSAIFEYIEVFYNRKRMHSKLGYLSPVEYEQLNSVN